MNSDKTEGKHEASLFSLNESAALAFSQIAEYLQLKGENPFKIKAYVKASRVLRDLEEDLDVISKRGELRSIAGVGKAIADKLESFLETGKIPQLEELKEEIPAGLMQVASIPGLGAKKTVLLHKELGVASLQDLEQACLDEQVETVKGFSKKSQAKILGLVEKALSSKVLFVKSRLEDWAELTAQRLSDVSGVHRAVVVGAVRRKAPCAERIEILLVCDDPQQATQDVLHRSKSGGGGATEENGDVILSHPSGCPIYLHFTQPEQAGWETLRLTGPPRFVSNFEAVSGEAEEAVFEAAEKAYVLPELRDHESPWDVEASLQEAQILGNLHAHTTWSDGAQTLEEMVSEAKARGQVYFGVSDHSRSLVIANGLTIERLREQAKEIEELSGRVDNFTIFRSVECDILDDGTLDYPDEVLHELDYVVAAVHSFFHLDKDAQTARLLAGLQHPKVKILAHPTGRKLTKRDGYTAHWETVFQECAKRGVAVEINASPWRLDVSEDLLQLAIDLDCLIAINTDAHSISEFDYVRHGVDMARRRALDPARVVNTWSVEKLSGWFAKN